MAKRWTEEERRAEVQGWRASGESMARYAARRGYTETSLRNWAAAEGTWSGAPGLVRLVVAAPARDRELVVEVGAARIRVKTTFDAELLRAVVAALSVGVST
ncbi:hypothetical protein [Chondromyces crocatus]|uniref:Transposase n=1 Tax=Chondromyces crocatus TaxID=52 RepID=A0A0K1EDQ9_CHOCO|nr:hypothetical protein [Chondromyces crocatus]AKT38703.1 uncharacterized protein CMC5_028510 [Chondromyces crocatus]